MNLKKILALLLAAVMVCGMLAGCGPKETGNPSNPPESQPVETKEPDPTKEPDSTDTPVEPVTLNIGYMNNYGSLWSVMTAKEKGYFEEEGITLELTSFDNGPNIIAAMENGSINLGYIGDGAHKLCVQGRASIIALSHVSNGDAVIGGPNVKTIEDLKGKTVAYASGTSSETILVNTLTKAGLTMNDITPMDMDPSAVVTAMMSKGVDACAIWSPQSLTILAEAEGATKLTDNMTFADTSVSLASWIAMPNYLEENKDVVVRFLRALFKGMDYAADDHYDEVAKWVSDLLAVDYDSIYAERGVAEWFTGKDVAAGIADGSIKAYYELQQEMMVKNEAITAEEKCPVEDYVHFDLMTEASNY